MNLLTSLQQTALTAFFAVPELKQYFYLTGETALAGFYLEHRVSDDLDFFTHGVEIYAIERIVEDAFKTAGLKLTKELGSPSFRRYKVNGELQMDLVKDVEFRLGSPELRDGIMVDNLKNIAVNKVCAIYGRLDPKDYVDLFFLIPYLNLNVLELLDWAKRKDAGIDQFQWAKVIADVETIDVLPRMVKPLKPRDLKQFFHVLRDQVLDSLNPNSQ